VNAAEWSLDRDDDDDNLHVDQLFESAERLIDDWRHLTDNRTL